MKHTLALLMLCLALCGCASHRVLDQPEPAAIAPALKEGDEVLIAARNGKTYRLTVTLVGTEALFGTSGSKRYKISYEMIESLEITRYHAWPAAAGLGGALTIGAVVALIAAFENAADQNWDFCGGN